jgi:chromosome segregation ATPase
LGSEPSVSQGTDSLHKEIFRLTSSVTELQNQNSLLLAEIHDGTARLSAKDGELGEVTLQLRRHEEVIENLRAVGGRLDREARDAEADRDALQARVDELEDELRDKMETLEGLDSDYRSVQDIKSEAKRNKAQVDQLQRQLLLVSTHANEKIGAMQNELQGYREFHRNQVAEFNEFVEQDRVDRKEFEDRYNLEYSTLKGEYDRFREAQFDDKRQMLRDQQDILLAMQAQFDEYRTTAEFLFNAEVAKLEEKLNMQALKFDHEIKYVVRAKDKAFDEMLSMKDAKIMNLIEGTDLRQLLVQHQTEMDGLRRAHDKEMERERENARQESAVQLGQLQKAVSTLEATVVKLTSQKKQLEGRIGETFALVEQRNRALQAREAQAQAEAEDYEKKLATVTARCTQLVQDKEHLRHALLRARLRIEGKDAGEGLDQLLSRLSAELEALRSKYDALVATVEDREASKAEALIQYSRARTLNARLQVELDKRTTAFRALTEAFGETLGERSKQPKGGRGAWLGTTTTAGHVPEPEERGIGAARTLIAQSVVKDSKDDDEDDEEGGEGVGEGGGGQAQAAARKPHPSSAASSNSSDKPAARRGEARVKARAPRHSLNAEAVATETSGDLQRAYVYLRRFKAMSRAFTQSATVAAINAVSSDAFEMVAPKPYETVSLYRQMDVLSDLAQKEELVYSPDRVERRVPTPPQKRGGAAAARRAGDLPEEIFMGLRPNQQQQQQQQQNPSRTPRVAGFKGKGK